MRRGTRDLGSLIACGTGHQGGGKTNVASEYGLPRLNSLTTRVTLLKFEKSCTTYDGLTGALSMKNVYEVLRQKEMELTRLEKEVEALRLVAPLLSEEKEGISEVMKPALATAVGGPQSTPSRI